MPDRFGSNESTYDSLRAITTSLGTAPATPGAPIDAAFVLVGNDSRMPNERALTAGRRQAQTDGGANSTLTYGVVDTYHLIVDPAGYGDYTTIQAALTYIEGLGVGASTWIILVRSGTYSEILSFNPTQLHPGKVSIVGDGNNVILNPTLTNPSNQAITLGNYSEVSFINLSITPGATAPTNGTAIINLGNGPSHFFYNCKIVPNANQATFSGNSTTIVRDCTIGVAGRLFVYGLGGSAGVSTLNVTYYSPRQ